MKSQETEYSYIELEGAYKAYSEIPLKGNSVMLAAQNQVDLKGHIDTLSIAREKVIKTNSNGKDKIDIQDPGWVKCIEELNALAVQKVKIKLKKIALSDIVPPKEQVIPGLQNSIALLMALKLVE